MKVTLNKLLKTVHSKLKFHEEKQVLQLCGTSLCIRSMLDTKSCEPDFITLGRSNLFVVPPSSSEQEQQFGQVVQVYDYLSSNNHQSIYTIQLVKYKAKTVVEICSYYLRELDSNSSSIGGYKAQRKSLQLSEGHGYVPLQQINSIQFIPEFFNNSITYVITKTRTMQCYCLNLVDLNKLKIQGTGFVPIFEYATTSAYDDGQLSILNTNSIKRIKIQQKEQTFMITDEKLPKKLGIMGITLIRHHWLGYNKLILATQKQMMITQGENNNTPHEIICTVPVVDENSQVVIVEMLVIRKNVIIFLSNLEIKVYADESDEGNYKYVLAESRKISEQSENAQTTIDKVEISKNMEELLIGLNNGEYYYSKFQGIQLGSQQNHLTFDKIPFRSHPSSKTGSVYASTAQNFCLISTQKKIQVWDMQRISIVNQMQFDIQNKAKTIKKCTMNPDGHSLCVAFPDMVRFYRLLINKFKQYSQFYIKNCSMIQYSHGGQMLAMCSGKNNNAVLTIIHTLKMKQVCNFKIGYTPRQIVWNEHDDEIFVSSEVGNLINIYKISTKSKESSLLFDYGVQYMRFDFSTNNLLVSMANGQIKVIDKQNQVISINPKIDGFSYIFPSDGLYFVTTNSGKLYYATNLNLQKKYEIPLFSQKFDIQYRKGCLIAYANPSNVVILKVKATLANDNQNPQPQIQNIMLVEKDQITKIFEKTKYLESQLDQLQNVTNIKLDDERKRYNELLDQHCLSFKQQIKEMNKRFVDLQVQSSKTDKHSQRKFEELENGQIRAVNELQKVYDRKIKMQKDKYLELEQQAMQDKMKYESMLSRLEERYHQDIQKIRKQYTQKLEQKAKQIEVQKSKNLGYKKKLETKLIDLEQENQLTLFQLQNNKDNNIKNLIQKNTRLEKQRDELLIEIHNMNDDHQQLADDYERISEKMQKNERSVMENKNRVTVLEKQIERREKMIEQKNITIEQQSHQISQLQKSKHVLTFRTFEIRKTLEPKEQLIDKLKADLMDLQQQSRAQNKDKFELAQKTEKYEKILQTLRKQNSDIKQQSKKKQTLHKNLCSDIYKVINNIDPKQWNSHFVEIYQNYVKDQSLNSNVNSSFKNDPTSEEINRHLVHVQQSLQQVATGNEKMLEGKKKEVQKKMKENAQLIFQLNVMRKKQNEHINEIKNKNILISRLKRQNKQARQLHKSTRANTAQTGFTRRNPSRDPTNISKGDLIDLNLKRQSDYLLPDRKGGRSRIISANRTMATREQSRKQKTRISDMARQLQFAKSTMARQQRIIQQLNQQLLGQIQQS